jgi:hypothetical protein
MSVTGLCQLCERGQAQFACDRCGTVVCDDHYDSATGLCTECAQEVRGGGGADDTHEPGDWDDSGPR